MCYHKNTSALNVVVQKNTCNFVLGGASSSICHVHLCVVTMEKGLGSPTRAGTNRKSIPLPLPVTNSIKCTFLKVLITVQRVRERESNYVSASLMHILSVSPYQQPEVQRSDPC